MNNVTLAGNPIEIAPGFLQKGNSLKNFILLKKDLSEVSLADFKGKGKKLIFNIFPSIDTRICSMSAKVFNEKATKLGNAIILCISNDLPFALDRFCGAEGIDNIETLSAFRSSFGLDYGVLINTGALKGLLTRAVIVADEAGVVIHSQLVPEIKIEPDYDAALACL